MNYPVTRRIKARGEIYLVRENSNSWFTRLVANWRRHKSGDIKDVNPNTEAGRPLDSSAIIHVVKLPGSLANTCFFFRKRYAAFAGVIRKIDGVSGAYLKGKPWLGLIELMRADQRPGRLRKKATGHEFR